MAKGRDARVASARAYYRLAAKADRAGQSVQGERYRNTADRLIAAARSGREAREARRKSEEAWKKRFGGGK